MKKILGKMLLLLTGVVGCSFVGFAADSSGALRPAAGASALVMSRRPDAAERWERRDERVIAYMRRHTAFVAEEMIQLFPRDLCYLIAQYAATWCRVKMGQQWQGSGHELEVSVPAHSVRYVRGKEVPLVLGEEIVAACGVHLGSDAVQWLDAEAQWEALYKHEQRLMQEGKGAGLVRSVMKKYALAEFCRSFYEVEVGGRQQVIPLPHMEFYPSLEIYWRDENEKLVSKAQFFKKYGEQFFPICLEILREHQKGVHRPEDLVIVCESCGGTMAGDERYGEVASTPLSQVFNRSFGNPRSPDNHGKCMGANVACCLPRPVRVYLKQDLEPQK